jgi:hypothetical protein
MKGDVMMLVAWVLVAVEFGEVAVLLLKHTALAAWYAYMLYSLLKSYGIIE